MENNTKWAIGLATLVLAGSFAAQVFLFPAKKQASQSAEQNASSAIQSEQTKTDFEQKSESSDSIFQNGSEIVSESSGIEETFVLETNKVRAVFTNRGGDLISYELKEHLDRDTARGVEMINNVTATNRAFAVSLGGFDSPIVNDIFVAKRIDERTIGFAREFSKKNADGSVGKFTFVKTYSFKDDDYFFKLDIAIDGGEGFDGLDTNGLSYTIRTAPQIGPKFDPKDRYDIREFVAFDGDKKFTPKNMKERDWKWVASAGKYFEILVSPSDSVPLSSSMKLVVPKKNGIMDNQAVIARKSLSGGKTRDSYMIYIGPRSESELKKYVKSEDNAWGIDATDGFHYNESLPTSGILNWLEIILKAIMQLIYRVIPNWGVSIIIMTILLKLALFPLTKKSLEGTQKMQAYQPRVKEIQEKYRGDPRKLQEETAKLYREIGYNPMAGCLPLIIQFVILWSMYHLFNNYFEFRGASFINGWISDLSSTDTVTTLPFSLPWLGNELHLLPIIYLISQLLYGVITQNGGTAVGQNGAQMKMMMYAMPILFFFVFYNAPSGLLLYWTVSNVFQLFQQLFVNRMMKNRPTEPTLVKAKTVAAKKSHTKKGGKRR